MPTDLTGTPTSLGIGTYNTSIDAPSGLGFNAAMGQIDALIAGRVAAPSGIAANEVPVWNGTTWVRSSATRINNGGTVLPAITTSTLAGGPPASPSDGDIWIATAVDANGTRWKFQYNAGSASVYKWEFIGGSAQFVTGTSSSLSATIARAGDYLWHWGVDASPSATFFQDILGATSGVVTGMAAGQNASSARGTLGGTAKVAGCSAAAAFSHSISSASTIFSVFSEIKPVRVI